jgi:hypothetical protein
MGLGRIIIGATCLATKMRPRRAMRIESVIPGPTLIPVEVLDAGEEREVPDWGCDCDLKGPDP